MRNDQFSVRRRCAPVLYMKCQHAFPEYCAWRVENRSLNIEVFLYRSVQKRGDSQINAETDHEQPAQGQNRVVETPVQTPKPEVGQR